MNAIKRKIISEKKPPHLKIISIRTKLIIGFLLILVVGGMISTSIGNKIVSNMIIKEAYKKALYNLSATWVIYNGKLERLRDVMKLTASRDFLFEYIKGVNTSDFLRKLTMTLKHNQLDFLSLTDKDGNVIFRICNLDRVGDNMLNDSLISRAIQGKVVYGTMVVSNQYIEKEIYGFTECIDHKVENKVNLHDRTYLVMGAAAPVCDEDYQILGILYGGVVINETDAIVRKINDEILQNEKYDGIDIGMALIAGWDREVFTDICSNERLQHSETVMLRKIYETILKNEKSWIGSVYFHERRYIAAYDPIKDIEGRIIGILGINLLAKPYIDVIIKHTVGWILIGACAVSLLTVIAFFLTTKIVRPIRTIVEATRKISQGDLDVHVDVGASDELSLLAGSFNEMVSRLKSARDRFEYRGKSLEEQVKERTREIEKIQSKIFQQEKLAIVGQLASSIAHEIGTPLNIVLGNAEYLVSEMDKDDPKIEELRDIIEQTEKLTERVKQLLSMARPRRAIMEETNVNQVLEKVLSILNPVIIKSSVTLVKDLACNIPNIIADSSQLEQVFINLIINSMDAMAGKGELKVMTSYVGDEQEERPVTVTFSDTGCGIPENCLTKIFDPFFTTKPYGYGTGLGLTVTYHIVEAHGGTIDVESEEDVGTTFIIKLPVSNVQLN